MKKRDGTIKSEVAHAMDEIAAARGRVALFLINGHVQAIRRATNDYEKRMRQYESCLIGVYDIGVDSRDVHDDILFAYRNASQIGEQAMPGVDIDVVYVDV